MIEKTRDITSKDGEMEPFICHPERNEPFPAVFLLMEAHGIREELKDMARRLGTVGYYVLLPNLCYRAGRDTIYGPSVHEEASAEHKRMRAVRTKMTIPPVMDDAAAMLAFESMPSRQNSGAPTGTQGDVRRGWTRLVGVKYRLSLHDLLRGSSAKTPSRAIQRGMGPYGSLADTSARSRLGDDGPQTGQ